MYQFTQRVTCTDNEIGTISKIYYEGDLLDPKLPWQKDLARSLLSAKLIRRTKTPVKEDKSNKPVDEDK